MAKIEKCPFCSMKYTERSELHNHMEKEHTEELHELPAAQVHFNWRNKYGLTKEYGRCVMSGKPTKFNLITERYERFAGEKEKLQYREYFRKNMINKYGKDTLLDEPEQQKKMLGSRSISGVYRWTGGKEITYTGSYERTFLEFLDTLGWENPDDIMAPAPMTFPYTDPDGKEKFHIPDFYIGSLNTIISIKSSQNQHYRLRDIEIEKLQDQAIKKSKFNYIKIYDNDFNKFLELVDVMKNQQKPKKVFWDKK
jgi:hypothetical protein